MWDAAFTLEYKEFAVYLLATLVVGVMAGSCPYREVKVVLRQLSTDLTKGLSRISKRTLERRP